MVLLLRVSLFAHKSLRLTLDRGSRREYHLFSHSPMLPQKSAPLLNHGATAKIHGAALKSGWNL